MGILKRNLIGLVGAFAVTGLLVTGCASGESSTSPSTEAVVKPSPIVTPSPSVSVVEVYSAENPRPVVAECPHVSPAQANDFYLAQLDGAFGDDVVEVRRDIPRANEFASGEVVYNEVGVPAAYVVAEGDVPARIADRFCTNVDWLSYLNQVRRDPFGSELVVHPGDVLNLNPYTITSVGDIQGVVRSNDPVESPGPFPPQR